MIANDNQRFQSLIQEMKSDDSVDEEAIILMVIELPCVLVRMEGQSRGEYAVSKNKLLPHGNTVLLAESDPSLRRLACDVLARENCNVISACDGKKALETAARHDCAIDLFVTDVVLPGFYGCHLAELLKFDYPQIKVIYLASFTDRDIRALARESKVILVQDSGWTDALGVAVQNVLSSSEFADVA